ncbi:MAG: PDZ domain-containing protein [Planctomycetes bacterium]|nr:PDZ domain-containing protein [Planctomycetota bacterium]
MTRYLLPVFAIALIGATVLQADDRGDKLRDLHKKFSDKVVVLTWTSTTSAMGQTIENTGSTTGLLVGSGGLIVVSAQPLSNAVGGMASMFGRGESSGPEGFKLHTADGKEYAATEALKSDDLNLRFYGAALGEGSPAAAAFGDQPAAPQLGDEVIVIGAYDETLNYARFFHVARINSVVEEGKYYGLDGSLGDCLGGVVLSMDGKVLGIVGQKKGKEASGGGGIGRMLGGLNDPSKALGNRVLMTSGVFGDEMKKAQEVVLKPDFGGGKTADPTPEAKDPAPATTGGFTGTVASVKYRDDKKDLYVLINVPEGQEAPAADSKLAIYDADGKQVSELVITRRYHVNPMDESSRIEQVGGFIPDPEKKLSIEKGMKVAVPKPVSTDSSSKGWRGIERFTKMGPDVIKDNFGGVKAGYSVSQIPEKGSPCREAGVKNGDLIYKVGDTEITAETSLQDFQKLLADANGDVKLCIARKDGEKVEITVPAE